VEVVRLAKEGGVWQPKVTVSQPLPPEVLPLSGDCLLWKTGPDTALVRLGYESFAVASFDLSPGAATPSTPFKAFEDIPIYGWSKELLLLRYGELDESSGSYPVSYALWDLEKGQDIQVEDGGVIQELLEPYTAVPLGSGDEAIFGPLSSDPTFATLEVAERSPSKGLTRVAKVTRTSSDRLYSARAFAKEGKVYLAWTEFHESQMDLWVAVAPSTSGAASALVRPPARVASFPFKGAAQASWRRP
jgi:hypothetical protein